MAFPTLLALVHGGGAAAASLASGAPGSGSNVFNDLLAGIKPDFVPAWAVPLTAAGICIALAMAMISVAAMGSVWLERKVAGHIQCRFGPMRVGWHGWLQPIADGVKLLLKEDMVPQGADKPLFVLAPGIVLLSIVAAFAVYPISPAVYFVDLNLGVFALVAFSSMTTIGVVMAGWASNSKWSLYGAMREAAQVVAYEIPLSLALLVPLIVAGTFNLREASAEQAGWWGMHWYVFQNPFMLPALLLFTVAVLAETKRAPFDLPETESELVAGFMTEYSGIRWSFFFMEEYAAMFLFSAVGAVFWFGGFNSPLTHAVGAFLGEGSVAWEITAALTLLVKSMAGVLLMMWLRWTLPRLRIDQVMTLGYKYLTPLALACVLGAGAWEVLIAPLWRD